MKLIPFNTEMVRAILDNRKTVTRRVIKPQPKEYQRIIFDTARKEWAYTMGKSVFVDRLCKTRYRPGDILYVGETWQHGFGGTYLYKASAGYDLFMTTDGELVSDIPWRPSTAMPKEAARIFLRVTDVRVERLQSIRQCGIQREGCPYIYSGFDEEQAPDWFGWMKNTWNNTIKPKDLAIYGWDANPWVEVTEFERISKEEATLTYDK